MRARLARALFAAALAVGAAALVAGACNPNTYDGYTLGGAGNGSAGGGGTTGTAQCGGFFSNDESCQGCFVDSTCCSQAASCGEDCKNYIGCLSQCAADDDTCEVSCKEAFSFAPSEVERLLACLADRCSQCGGLLSDRGPIGAPQGAGGGGSGGAPSTRCQGENACAKAACLDCDQADGTGSCETDTLYNKTNCGACGRDCLSTSCVDGQCLSASAVNGVRVGSRLALGGGYLYWVSTKGQITTLKGDTIYRVNVASGGQPEVAFEPAGELTIFDLSVDATHFYFVSNQGLRMREHASTGQPFALAAEQNPLFADPRTPPRAGVAANDTTVYFTTPLAEGDGTQLWAAPKVANAAAQTVDSFSSARISMLRADQSGVFVGSTDEDNEPGVWYVPNGNTKRNVYPRQAGDFALGGDDLIVLNDGTFEDRLVALPKAGGAETVLVERTPPVNFRALAADATGLYYLGKEPQDSRIALMRVRRRPGTAEFDPPVKLLSDVPRANTDFTLALDDSWVYGVNSDATSIWHVPK